VFLRKPSGRAVGDAVDELALVKRFAHTRVYAIVVGRGLPLNPAKPSRFARISCFSG
jgi:hypothetical protein